MSAALMEFFNKQPRLGTLSTAGKDGMVNSAFFGSPRMTDEKTIVMASGKNRTLGNLQENPNAVFLIMEPGEKLPDWKGLRLYVRMTKCETSGEQFEAVKAGVAERVGKETADRMVHAALTFELQGIRPLVDMGQSWEKSI